MPQFNPDSQTMKDYKRHVAVFRLRTAIPAEKQGPELYAELKGQAWDQAEELDPNTLFTADGVEQLLTFLGRKFDDTKVMELGDELRKFFLKMRRTSGENVRDYINRFDGQVGRLKLLGVIFPDEALAWLFVWWLSLPAEREAGILNANFNKYELEPLQRHALQNIRDIKDIDKHRAPAHAQRPRRWNAHMAEGSAGADAEQEADPDEEELDSEGGGPTDDEIPKEVLYEEQEASLDVLNKLERAMVRAKDRQKEAKSARGFYRRPGGSSATGATGKRRQGQRRRRPDQQVEGENPLRRLRPTWALAWRQDLCRAERQASEREPGGAGGHRGQAGGHRQVVLRARGAQRGDGLESRLAGAVRRSHLVRHVLRTNGWRTSVV